MTYTRILVPESDHTYLGIPYDEEIVPFPNFGTILIQHRRYLPNKPAFIWNREQVFTFKEWTSCVRILSDALKFSGLDQTSPVSLLSGIQSENVLLFHALLDAGIPAGIGLDEDTQLPLPFSHSMVFPDKQTITGPDGQSKIILAMIRDILKNRPVFSDPFHVPGIRLDHPAVLSPIKNVWAEFSHYNILSAAQSVGQELSLFREGETLYAKSTGDLSDWLFATLASFYYGSATRFESHFEPGVTDTLLKENKTQVLVPDISLTGVFNPKKIPRDHLRDMAFLYRIPPNMTLPEKLPFPWRTFWTAPVYSGNGFFIKNGFGTCCKGMDFQVIDASGQVLTPPAEGRLKLAGHSVPHALWLPPDDSPGPFLQDILCTPFYVRNEDPHRMSFIVLDDQ